MIKHYLKNLFPLIIGIAIIIALNLLVNQTIDDYVIRILINAGINITLAVSLNLVSGITGQFSMGHAGFMSVGAYTAAYLTTNFLGTFHIPGLPDLLNNIIIFGITLYTAGLIASLAGLIVGLPSLRLKGDYLAIVTLGFGEIVRVIFLNVPALGGSTGISGIAPWTNLAWVAIVALLTITTVRRILHSSHGRALLAIREDEIAAQAMGVNTTRYKVTAFVIGAFFAGVAGGLYAHHQTVINPKYFDFTASFEIIIMVVLGGMGSVSGAVVAALSLTCLKEALRPLQDLTGIDLRMILYALTLIIVMLNKPTGLFGRKEISDFGFFKKFKKARSVIALVIMASLMSADLFAQETTHKSMFVHKWTLKGFAQPESVIYDAKRNIYYVSNVNGVPNEKDGNGFLSTVKPDGSMGQLEWVKGLNAPKGLAIQGDTLYVADIDNVILIDLNTGKIAQKISIPNSKFLNDMVADAQHVFVSDMLDNTIYEIKNGQVTVFIKDEKLEFPNGLVLRGDELFVASWGVMTDGFATKVPGHVKIVSVAKKEIQSLKTSPHGNLDGIAFMESNGVVVSDWMSGKITFFNTDGYQAATMELKPGTADLTYITSKRQLLIPMMNDSELQVYEDVLQ